MASRTWTHIALIAAIVAAAVGTYLAGLPGGFVLDDFHNIAEKRELNQENWSIEALAEATASGRAGRLKRPVAMFTFALDAWIGGLRPVYMKAVNILLHSLTGILVLLLTRRIVSAPALGFSRNNANLAAIAALALWILHPIHVTTVLYIVQRMTILAALFALASILSYLKAREASRPGGVIGWLGLHWVLLALAALSKENGLLTIPLIIVMELTVFRFLSTQRTPLRWVKGYIAFLTCVCIAAAGYVIIQFDSLTGAFQYRDFTLAERLLTQPRVILHYVSLLVAPIPHRFSIFKDGFETSQGLADPAATAIALAALALIIAIALYRAWRGPSLLAFGVLWFLVAHSMEAGPFSLELVFEHRNYLPTIGLVAAIAALAIAPKPVHVSMSVRLFCVSLFVGLLAACTFITASTWANPVEHALISAHQNPDSARAQYAAGTVYVGLLREGENVTSPAELFDYVERAKLAEEHLQRAARLAPDTVAPIVEQFILFGEVNKGDPLWDQLLNRLSKAKLRPAADRQMLRLITCSRSAQCQIPRSFLISACAAGAGNTQTQPGMRAAFHLLAASVLAVEFEDLSAANQHVKSALDLAPRNEQFNSQVTRFLKETGQTRDQLQARNPVQ